MGSTLQLFFLRHKRCCPYSYVCLEIQFLILTPRTRPLVYANTGKHDLQILLCYSSSAAAASFENTELTNHSNNKVCMLTGFHLI